MYKHIDSNRRKSWLLIALFIGILSAAGASYGYARGDGAAGLLLALLFSLGFTLLSWFSGDKIVLSQSGAEEVRSRDQNPYVWNLVENLCITAGLPKPRIFLVPDPSPNAFATGRDPKHASIALTTGIISLLENEELEGVIAHELSHIKNLDTRFMMLVAILVGSLSLLGNFFLHGGFWGRSRTSHRDASSLLAFLGILFLVLSPVIGELIKLAISRRREYLADASGALLTRYPEGLARALQKISQHAEPLARASQATAHLWISDPFMKQGIRHRATELFSTHPPVEKRIEQLRRMEQAR